MLLGHALFTSAWMPAYARKDMQKHGDLVVGLIAAHSATEIALGRAYGPRGSPNSQSGDTSDLQDLTRLCTRPEFTSRPTAAAALRLPWAKPFTRARESRRMAEAQAQSAAMARKGGTFTSGDEPDAAWKQERRGVMRCSSFEGGSDDHFEAGDAAIKAFDKAYGEKTAGSLGSTVRSALQTPSPPSEPPSNPIGGPSQSASSARQLALPNSHHRVLKPAYAQRSMGERIAAPHAIRSSESGAKTLGSPGGRGFAAENWRLPAATPLPALGGGIAVAAADCAAAAAADAAADCAAVAAAAAADVAAADGPMLVTTGAFLRTMPQDAPARRLCGLGSQFDSMSSTPTFSTFISQTFDRDSVPTQSSSNTVPAVAGRPM